jgi:hypothetical protein
MKQIILLEDHEVARLQKGKTLMITTAAGDVGLQFLTRNGFNHDAEAEKSSKSLRCDVCGAMEGAHGPFLSKASLSAHKREAHSKNTPRPALRCDVCNTTTDKHGKPFKSPMSLSIHRRKMHSGVKHA